MANREAERYRAVKITGLASLIPMSLLAGPLVGYFAGRYLDERLGTDLVFVAILSVLGFVGGVRQSIRILKEIEAASTSDSGPGPKGRSDEP